MKRIHVGPWLTIDLERIVACTEGDGDDDDGELSGNVYTDMTPAKPGRDGKSERYTTFEFDLKTDDGRAKFDDLVSDWVAYRNQG